MDNVKRLICTVIDVQLEGQLNTDKFFIVQQILQP